VNGVTREFASFVAVGAVATAAHYVVLFVLTEFVHWHPAIGALLGAAVGAVVAYTLNRAYTFSVRPAYGRGLAKFAILAAIGAALNGLIVWGLVSLGLYYLWAQVAATGVTLIWNYLGSRLIVFRAEPGS